MFRRYGIRFIAYQHSGMAYLSSGKAGRPAGTAGEKSVAIKHVLIAFFFVFSTAEWT